ncbi:tRNA (Uracil 5) methyltransferase Methyltransferase small domain [Trypanosoma vivax]|uniref:tRNA (Uracil-5-)-methyltransferase n=1 Tax=Trypanosoma vivax (strain Y486) TaxID=1055687 RepID=G0TRC5_TRYVY|nr:hypothetical protein TRVL_06660 [Trypanosoma vivax]KAH8612599.1 tRNA (Uracil 5) methyltransferase Methyltransferase small domain [Trypanosoma vivax]CCC46489.1 conserved hypothetical protein [Trypanosoma vivax Y486]
MTSESETDNRAPCASSEGFALREHANENLLKLDTHDKYSTTTTIRKMIMRSIPPPTTNSPPCPLFSGLLRMRKSPSSPFLFLAFRTPEERAIAAQHLRCMSYRGKVPWHEVPVTSRDLHVTHKGGTRKRQRDEGSAGVRNVSQWEDLPMEEQLARKRAHCLKVMRSITAHGKSISEGLFTAVHPSPEVSGYRNHVLLTFGFTESGEPAIGFLKGAMVEGIHTIDSVLEKDIVTMSPLARVVAHAVMSVYGFFRAPERGGLEVQDKLKGEGFWRRLQVRHNVRGEVMVDIELDADSVPPNLLEAVKDRLIGVLQGMELQHELRNVSQKETAIVVSAHYHHGTGMTTPPPDAQRFLLFGAPTLTEHLSGLQFKLSPASFFQVNTPAMELLLRELATMAVLGPGTTLLDLCCGPGTIGLALAKHVKRVIGIELVESAVQDAKLNAELNNISNTTFHCGRVEHVLPEVIRGLLPEDRSDVVAVLDPPRAGVTPTVLKWIRGTPSIRRVVYISCEQKALERDCPPLTKPPTKMYRELPFRVVSSFAVDLFPHTPHVEMVVALARCDNES